MPNGQRAARSLPCPAHSRYFKLKGLTMAKPKLAECHSCGELLDPKTNRETWCSGSGWHRFTATDREEHEPCQRGTHGCSIDHNGQRDDDCETW